MTSPATPTNPMQRRVLHGSGRYLVLALALGLGFACARPPPAVAPAPPPEAPAPAPRRPSPPGPCLHIERLVANKSERSLRVHCEGGAVFTFPAAFGRETGAKRAAGDERTPEGEYRIAGPARPSRFHRFVPIDYPSQADADAALAAGRLSRGDHRRIVEAHRRGVPPPADTPLGGSFGLHGEGSRWRGDSKQLDWTYGCIALPDAELDFVVDRIRTGTPITILPH